VSEVRVGLSAEPLFQRIPTGVGVYALALCRGLVEIGHADDLVFFHTPSHTTWRHLEDTMYHYKYDIQAIKDITDPLGIPWNPIETQGQDFSLTVQYIGFLWNLREHSVSLPEKKHLKYLGKVSSFIAVAQHSVSHKDCPSLHGTLQHMTFIFQEGWSTLPPFLTFLAKFPNDYTRHHILNPVIESLCW